MQLPFLFINGPWHKQHHLVTVDKNNIPVSIWNVSCPENPNQHREYEVICQYYAHEYCYQSYGATLHGFVFLDTAQTPDFDLIHYCKTQGINL